MTERGDEPARRLRPVPDQPSRETAESVLPGVPRVGALDALLREVDGLRLTLEADLSLAASAVEAGAPDIAADILESDREGLREFESRALDHLAELSEDEPVLRHRRRVHVPAAPFVAAAAVVGFLLGVVPHTAGQQSDLPTSTVAATSSLTRLTDAAANGSTGDVVDAAFELHEQLAAVVAQAKTDPDAAKAALALLSAERAVLAQSGDSAAVRAVLAQSSRLSNLILQALPPAVRTSVPRAPTTVVFAAPTSSPTPSPASSPKAAPSPKASSSPTPKATSSPTPTAQPSSSSPGLPTSPALHP
jgi:hypothetical protein